MPRLLTGFSVTDGIAVPSTKKRNLSASFPFFRTIALDLVGLKLILAQEMRFSRPWSIHLAPGADVVVTVRSSIKALMGGCRVPDLDRGPLHSVSAALTTMFMATAKRLTEIVHPVIMPFSSLCQSDVKLPEVTLSLKFP